MDIRYTLDTYVQGCEFNDFTNRRILFGIKNNF